MVQGCSGECHGTRSAHECRCHFGALLFIRVLFRRFRGSTQRAQEFFTIAYHPRESDVPPKHDYHRFITNKFRTPGWNMLSFASNARPLRLRASPDGSVLLCFLPPWGAGQRSIQYIADILGLIPLITVRRLNYVVDSDVCEVNEYRYSTQNTRSAECFLSPWVRGNRVGADSIGQAWRSSEEERVDSDLLRVRGASRGPM